MLVGDVKNGGAGGQVDLEQTAVAEQESLRLEEGDQGVFFLWRKRDSADAVYRLVNSQGVALVEDVGDDAAAVSETSRSDRLTSRVESLTLGELRSELELARVAIQEGRVTSQATTMEPASE